MTTMSAKAIRDNFTDVIVTEKKFLELWNT